MPTDGALLTDPKRAGLKALPAWAKAGLVAGGYAAAILSAYVAVCINDAFMDPVTAQGGMAAFGDLILFVLVFCFVSILPTGLAVYFLIGLRKA